MTSFNKEDIGSGAGGGGGLFTINLSRYDLPVVRLSKDLTNAMHFVPC
jgi:hypothetical protein